MELTATPAAPTAYAVPLMDPKTSVDGDAVDVQVVPIHPETEPSRSWNDWPFAVLFLGNVLFMGVALVHWGLDTVRVDPDPAKAKTTLFSTAKQTQTILYMALAMAAVALVLSLTTAVLVTIYTRRMVIILQWTAVVVAAAATIVACIMKSVWFIIFGVPLTVCFALYACVSDKHIPFVVVNVRVARAAIGTYWSTYVVAVLFTFAQTAWLVLSVLVLLGVAKATYHTVDRSALLANGELCKENDACASNSCRYGNGRYLYSKKRCAASFPGLEHVTTANYVAYVALLVCVYWGLQVLRRISNITACGTVAAFWYGAESKFTTGAALCRSVTTSFGSICLGSLVGAAVQVMRLLASQSNQEGSILGSLAECLLICIQDFVETITPWAYVYVAMYGFKLTRAGRAVLNLFAKRHFLGIVDTDFLPIVLSIAAISIGLVCASIGAYIANYTDLVTFTNNTYFLSILGFFVGAGVAITPLSVLDCAITTIFVCFAEDPAAFAVAHPELYSVLVTAWAKHYPRVMAESGYYSARLTAETTQC